MIMNEKSPILKGKYRLIKVNPEVTVYDIEITDKIRGSLYVFEIPRELPKRIILERVERECEEV